MRQSKVHAGQVGRDKGRYYHIQEMDSEEAEMLAYHVIHLLGKHKVDIGNVSPEMGMAGLAQIALNSLAAIPPEEAKPIFEKMMSCVSYLSDPRHPEVLRPLMQGDIEEVMTRVQLKQEVVDLHMGFLTAGEQSDSSASTTTTDQPSKIIRTRPAQSASSPRRGLRA